eukprot:4991009-Amphidinium_carterae.1
MADTTLYYGPHEGQSCMVVHIAYNGVDHYDAVQGVAEGNYKRQRVLHHPASLRSDRDIRDSVSRHCFVIDRSPAAADWPEALDARFNWVSGRTRHLRLAVLHHFAQSIQPCCKRPDSSSLRGIDGRRPQLAAPVDILQQATLKRDADLLGPDAQK